MRKLLLVLLTTLSFTTAAADWKTDAAVVVGSAVFMNSQYANTHCIKDPCNAISHAVIGSALSTYVRSRTDNYWYGVLAGSVYGVGKEVFHDRNFDAKDALMTVMGSLLSFKINW